MSATQTICRRCIMDTSAGDITFDADGVCNYCRLFDRRLREEVFSGEAGRERLEKVVERIRRDGRGRPYDCVVGVSGGVDSTMAALAAVRAGLRPLAVHLDNGWNSELAVDNIKRLLDRLGLDLYTHVIDWDEFRDLQVAFLRSSVPNAEIPTDHAIVATMFQVANRHGIRYIITGSNVATEAYMPKAWAYEAVDLRHLEAVHRRHGTMPLVTFPRMGLPQFLYYVFAARIRWISILNLVGYQRAASVAMLQEEIGWRAYGGKHTESVYTRFYQGYILPTKYGFDKRRAHLSNLVCAGELTREEALAEMTDASYVGSRQYFEDRDFVLKKLQLSPSEFDLIMKEPAKLHSDFARNAFLYQGPPSLVRMLKGKLVGA